MNLIDYLPDSYANSSQVVSIQAAINTQAAALRAARDGLLAQLNVSTATWGLDAWEEALGITKKASDSTADRRTRVISKLRGSGTTTAQMIESVAESFFDGSAAVTEYPAEYRFDIRMTATAGGDLELPANMDDLTAAIEEVKPAHLAHSYSAEDAVTSAAYEGCVITEYWRESIS